MGAHSTQLMRGTRLYFDNIPVSIVSGVDNVRGMFVWNV